MQCLFGFLAGFQGLLGVNLLALQFLGFGRIGAKFQLGIELRQRVEALIEVGQALPGIAKLGLQRLAVADGNGERSICSRLPGVGDELAEFFLNFAEKLPRPLAADQGSHFLLDHLVQGRGRGFGWLRHGEGLALAHPENAERGLVDRTAAFLLDAEQFPDLLVGRAVQGFHLAIALQAG